MMEIASRPGLTSATRKLKNDFYRWKLLCKNCKFEKKSNYVDNAFAEKSSLIHFDLLKFTYANLSNHLNYSFQLQFDPGSVWIFKTEPGVQKPVLELNTGGKSSPACNLIVMTKLQVKLSLAVWQSSNYVDWTITFNLG